VCADWSKEHSNAPRPCVWNAILHLDYHSLSRQRRDVILSVARQHLTKPIEDHVDWPASGAPEGHFKFILLVMMIVHGADERCARPPVYAELQSPNDGHEETPSISVNASSTSSCSSVEAFDATLLPYRWLPGLSTTQRLLTADKASSIKRFEVMHIADCEQGECAV
jgi:hypothetical protein